MKRMIFILALLVSPFFVNAQDFIDDVFSKYSGKDDFTSIAISKDMLDFAFTLDDDKELEKLKDKISDLKILVSKHHSENNLIFTNEIRSNLSSNNFLALIEIQDGKNKVNFYAKKDGGKIVHLLLLATDDDEDVLLSLKGQISMKELAEMGENTNEHGSFHHLSYLKNLDKK